MNISNHMSLIDGIGDEVIEFFIGLVIIVIGAAAWWSTRIADRPLIRTVVVFERRTQNHHTQATNLNSNTQSSSDEQQRIEQDQRNYVQDIQIQNEDIEPETRQENKPPIASTSLEGDNRERDRTNNDEFRVERVEQGSGDNNDEIRTEDERSAIVETMDSDACVLRRRRLEFFQNRQDTLLASPIAPHLTQTQSSNNLPIDDDLQLPSLDDEENHRNNDENNENTSRADSTETTETTIDEDDIRIKLKYINDDLKLVNGKLQEPLGDFKRRHFECELSSDKLVRLIFNGHVLQRDDMTLQGCGLFDNCVVHCLVHQKRQCPNTGTSGSASGSTTTASSGNGSGDASGRTRGLGQPSQPGREWDLGNLFFAIVSFVLGAAWYFRYEYAQLYTVTATVALVGLTGIFTVLLVGMYFPDPEPPVQPVRS